MRLTNEQAYLVQLGLISKALAIMSTKRQDYSGPNDPYRNFRVVEGIFEPGSTAAKPAVGATIRLMDKVTRIARAAAGSGRASGESVLLNDGVDVINYACIIAGLLLEATDDTETLDILMEAGNAFLQRLSGDD